MEHPLYSHKSQIAFADTDASGWLHFPNIFRYVEAAEHECLRKLGVMVYARDQGGWPRVNVNCDFVKPLLTADPIEVQLAVAEIGKSSLKWEFEVHHEKGELAARGSYTVVRVDSLGKAQLISLEERKALSGE